MEETKKTPSPMAWVLGQTGDHGGQYVLSVVLAVIGVAFSLAPYFVVIGIVQGLMGSVKDFAFYLNRCLIMAALWLGRVLFHALSTATSHKATFAVLGEIRKRCMEKLTRMPLGTVLEQSSGALKNTLIERIDSIETTLAHMQMISQSRTAREIRSITESECTRRSTICWNPRKDISRAQWRNTGESAPVSPRATARSPRR